MNDKHKHTTAGSLAELAAWNLTKKIGADPTNGLHPVLIEILQRMLDDADQQCSQAC